MSTDILQEFSTWQIATALGFLLAGFVMDARTVGGSATGRMAALLGMMLAFDEMFLVHECMAVPMGRMSWLSLEFAAALSLGVRLMRSGVLKLLHSTLVILLGVAAAAALLLDMVAQSEELMRLEEWMELGCALGALTLALIAPGRGISWVRFFVRSAVWLAFGCAAAWLFLQARPGMCPEVDSRGHLLLRWL